ncbi:MAG TPA: hypothetical protein DCP61_04005 [Treponema sp.]|nr:hypothetical protein [Treponema sp.]
MLINEQKTFHFIINYVILFVMAKGIKKLFFSRNTDILALIAVAVLILVLSALKFFTKFDYRIYDVLVRLSPKVEQEENILLVDIDDLSLNKEGSWPWTRDLLGNVLIRMKELGAYNAIFDIEYLSPASKGAAADIATVTEETFGNGEQRIAHNIEEFTSSIQRGEINSRNAIQKGSELTGRIDEILYGMYGSIYEGVNRDFDDYFARAIQFFGNTSLTVNAYDIKIDRTKEDLEYAKERFLFNVQDPKSLIRRENEEAIRNAKAETGFTPVLHAMGSRAACEGFTNVIIDTDGTRRRIELFNWYDGKYIGQLAFAPLVKMLDVQSFERKRKSLLLRGALLPGKEKREDIKIPLDENGRMMINWQHSTYNDSFRHVPVYMVLHLDKLESSAIKDLESLYSLRTAGGKQDEGQTELSTWLSYIPDILEGYGQIVGEKKRLLGLCQGFDIQGNAIGGGISDEEYQAYFSARSQFFQELESFSQSLLSLEGSAGEEGSKAIKQFSSTVSQYSSLHERLAVEFANSFCLIGNSATASTDLGVTPFQRGYPNLGTHANVANSILQKNFIRTVNPLTAIIASLVFTLAIILLTRKFPAFAKNAAGLLYLFPPTIIFSLLMILFRIYVPLVAPFLLALFTYIAQMVLNFALAEKEKRTLRRGFDAYVAPEVVNQIVKNPSLLSLGGANKRMTALFSDVRTFSGFTECINREEGEQHGAVRLVDILNGYLGVLSDAIMDCHGTIDKYVGDEIVSFFGAPVDDPLNAYNACLAGIRMKQAEAIYNEEHKDELPIHPVTHTPFLLKSRVGINTGDMVVGNMGTQKKLNYTVMGNNVNLASRLEGTNKAYDSWIMCSESTWQEANSGQTQGLLVARQLDCVRVINVEKPVQIYSIAGLKSELKKEELESVELFNKAMEWYLKGREEGADPKDIKDFSKAKKLFSDAYRCNPTSDVQDKNYISPEKKMIVRCENFIANGLPRDVNGDVIKWDGVYTMTSK